MTLTRIQLLAAALYALLAVGVTPTQATTLTVVDSLGFETPFSTTFQPMGGGGYAGQLEGQVPGPVPPNAGGTWLQSSNTGTSTATIQTAEIDTGVQAVQVNHTGGSENRWGVPVGGWPNFNPPAPGSPPLPYICIDWSMRVDPSAGPLGPFFGVEANDDDGNAVGRLGLFGVDSATGAVFYDDGVNLIMTTATVGLGGAPGANWNDFRMILDYSTDTYSFILNGVLLGTAPFSDAFLGLDQFTDANIYSTNAGVGSINGTAYYDNFTVVNTDVNKVVPEPGTCVLALLAAVGLMTARRKEFRA